MLRLVSAALLALSLAGCVTVSNTLPAEQVAGFRLAGVSVGFAGKASIWWGDAERACAASRGLPAEQSDALGATEEGRAFVRQRAADTIRAAMERELRPDLTGSRPVRVEVTVKDLLIASAIQRVLVGGGHHLTADVTLVDAQSGAALQTFPDQTIIAPAGQGIAGTLIEAALMDDPAERVARNLAARYAQWLLRKAPPLPPATPGR